MEENCKALITGLRTYVGNPQLLVDQQFKENTIVEIVWSLAIKYKSRSCITNTTNCDRSGHKTHSGVNFIPDWNHSEKASYYSTI